MDFSPTQCHPHRSGPRQHGRAENRHPHPAERPPPPHLPGGQPLPLPDGTLLPAAGGAGLVVAKARDPVVPIRLFGAYEALHYGAAAPKLTTATAVVGEPVYFPASEYPETKEGYQQISNRIIAAIGALSCPPDRLP